ncbi:hypothetical protein [Roseovarius ramblicola]|uniref:SMODS and SLOG-associating 2TM effector domain-containing protein n=1 Tax=Roseovarius ramblicola TaxID=2022336 RepID=A0ABV5HYT2_9RHOB
MKLNGYEVFSRQTVASWRLLVFASTTLIAVKFFDYNNEAWPLLGKNIAPNEFEIISSVTVAFLAVSFLVNWYGDYIGFARWFKRAHVVKNSIEESGAAENTESPLEGLKRRLRQLEESNENAEDRILELEAFSIDDLQSVQGDRNVSQDLETLRSTTSSNKSTLELMNSQVGDLKALLGDLGPNFSQVSAFAKILFFGWYLLLPLGLAIFALLLR